MRELDLTTLREYLRYDPETGVFTWRKARYGVRVGIAAGSQNKVGYVEIRVNRRLYLAHRLAWFYSYGEWPKQQIDHINGVRSDNRLSNLRDVPQGINLQNERKPRKSNPYLGVSQKGTRWVAQIHHAGVHRYLGLFSTPEDAHAAYVEAKRKMHVGCTI
jgi:hypothetical protein